MVTDLQSSGFKIKVLSTIPEPFFFFEPGRFRVPGVDIFSRPWGPVVVSKWPV